MPGVPGFDVSHDELLLDIAQGEDVLGGVVAGLHLHALQFPGDLARTLLIAEVEKALGPFDVRSVTSFD